MKHYVWKDNFGVGLSPGFDYRNNPEKRKYGQHPATMWLALRGNAGVIQLEVSTGWYLNGDVHKGYCNLSAHSELTIKNAAGDEHTITDNCDLLEGRACACTLFTGIRYNVKDVARLGLEGMKEELQKVYDEHYGKDA